MTHRPGTVAPAIALATALCLALGACASASPAASAATGTAQASPPAADSPEPKTSVEQEPVEVELSDSSFHPETLTISAGTEVVFVNGDDYDHTVTEGSDGRAAEDPFVDEDLGQEPVSVTFDEAGTFQLTCRLHPTMNMTISVEG